ncbi:MAG: MBL fold metallo-hydrolase [Saprospiraceae bacterium]|nr:MBL fold metallo-hydrolase [Saprospiraceae bacterium]
MKIEQIYTGCLAQGAYYIVSEGEAAIVDPLREIAPYLHRLEKDGVKLKYIFETHFHADFVSGHVDLAKATGAAIIYGPTAVSGYESITATDGQIFELGKIKFKVLHTPGHTLESSSFLLIDEHGKDYCVFSGDTLFIGDVGRPDLAQKAANMTQDQLAALLFHSLRDKIMVLADDVIVYPAHGAGSACGKNMSKETVSTIGIQKATNYALRANMTEAEFVKEVTDGLLPPPVYFGANVAMNKMGYDEFDTVLKHSLKPLAPEQFEVVAEETGALILDTRDASDFCKGFVPQAINIGVKGDFAPWAGALIGDVKHNILLITYPGQEEEAVTRLSRVGFDRVIGYLDGGVDAWIKSGKEVDKVNRISLAEFENAFAKGNAIVYDVRRVSEYTAEHVEDAYNKPLDYINDWIKDVQPSEHFYIHCAGGYRSMIAASILQARGYRNFSEVEGGFAAIKEDNKVKCTDFVCQSKMMSF